MKLVALALLYWALVFAFAFMLGIVRVLWVAPALGAVAATMIELPLVLGVSWLVTSQLLRRNPAVKEPQALVVGLIAFALLMLAEFAFAKMLGGGSLAIWLAGFTTLAGALGLLGQVGFALIPWLAARTARP